MAIIIYSSKRRAGDYMIHEKRGFTLIEVIVSIGLLGLLATVFIPSFANQFKWLVDTKTTITQDAFEVQDNLEAMIKKVKIALLEGEIASADYVDFGITAKLENIKLFESEFSTFTSRQFPNAYQLEQSIGEDKKFTTLVSDKRIPELPVPEIEGKYMVFLQDGGESPLNHEYFNYLGLKLKATSNMKSNPQNSFNRYRNDWYVSKPGFNIPVQDISTIDVDNDFGRIYPKFPDDYEASPIHSDLGSSYSYVSMTERNITVELNNNIVNQYPGRHILYTITPFAKSLKRGITSTILPKYIYGPDITDNLALHLDASTINMVDIYHNTNNTSGALVIQDNFYHIRNWKNSRTSLKSPTTNRNAIQTTMNNMPVLVRNNDPADLYTGLAIPFQEGDINTRVWSRALGNKSTTFASMTSQNLSIGNSWSAFLIMRMVVTPATPSIDSIVQGNGTNPWSIGWIGDLANPRLGFTQSTIRAELASPLNLGEWYLVRITANSPNITLEATSLKKGSEQVLLATGSMNNINTTNLNLQWNGVEISEVLVYTANLNQDSLIVIKTYLESKYNPDI